MYFRVALISIGLATTAGCSQESTPVVTPPGAAPVTQDQDASATSPVAADPLEDSTTSTTAEPSVIPDAAPGFGQSVGSTGFTLTSREGWTYNASVQDLGRLQFSKDVSESPPGKARLMMEYDGGLRADLAGATPGRQAPSVAAVGAWWWEIPAEVRDSCCPDAVLPRGLNDPQIAFDCEEVHPDYVPEELDTGGYAYRCAYPGWSSEGDENAAAFTPTPLYELSEEVVDTLVAKFNEQPAAREIYFRPLGGSCDVYVLPDGTVFSRGSACQVAPSS